MAPVLSPVLRVFSGGAAQGLCEALGPVFESTQACRIDGHFGAVGGMRDRLRAGEPCDVVILTQALVAALAEQGLVVAADAVPVGMVATGVAVGLLTGNILKDTDAVTSYHFEDVNGAPRAAANRPLRVAAELSALEQALADALHG